MHESLEFKTKIDLECLQLKVLINSKPPMSLSDTRNGENPFIPNFSDFISRPEHTTPYLN